MGYSKKENADLGKDRKAWGELKAIELAAE